MTTESLMQRYRNCYARLLRLYPKRYRERFGEGMAQTFNDLLREQVKQGKGLFRCTLGMFADTLTGIVRENLTFIIMQKSIVRTALRTGLILLIPLFGNLFIEGWDWSVFDFIVGGGLLFGAGLAYELVAKRMSNKAYKFAVGLAVGTAFILTWVNLAVEIIGDDNPANLLFFAVPLVGLIGATLGRFEPRGMARALSVTALVQALIPVIALVIWSPAATSWSPGVVRVFCLNSVFVMLFLGSALLFRYASGNAVRGEVKV